MRTMLSCVAFLVFASAAAVELLGAERADPLRREVRDALQDSMRLSHENREAVVYRLVDLYGQLSIAEPVGDANRQRMQAQLRARLSRLSAIIRRQMELDAAAGQAVPDKTAASRPAAPANVMPINGILAQRFAPPAAAPGALAGGAGQAAGFRRAAFGVGPNFGPAGQPPDNGQALVDLIQRTIAPASWDVNGGPGSIVYFRPSRALVVRQRSEVHEQLQGVVRALRQ